MNTDKFLEILKDELSLEGDLSLSTNLKDLDEWDSMTAMMLLGILSDHFDLDLNFKDLEKVSTVDSLIDVIGRQRFSS